MEKNWDKKYHVESSMANDDKGFHAFLGRFQPLHDGHKQLFQQVLDEGKNVCIMVRDIKKDEKNPFTANEVATSIIAEYVDLVMVGRVRVIVVPNIVSLNFGRGVGYDIIEFVPPMEIAQISATSIREQMRKDGKI
ncbi:MAG: cytidyltransferase [Chitinophagia bacterium]|nr:cytidyltransferase [Chitinophagia bacterium]